LFAIEREINGLAPQERLRVRQEPSRPLIVELEAWLRQQRAKLSRNNDTTKGINYCLNRWDAFTRFLGDGRLCMSNNAAERELRAVAVDENTGPSPGPVRAAGAQLRSIPLLPAPNLTILIHRLGSPTSSRLNAIIRSRRVTLTNISWTW